jgi:hypothetical protein
MPHSSNRSRVQGLKQSKRIEAQHKMPENYLGHAQKEGVENGIMGDWLLTASSRELSRAISWQLVNQLVNLSIATLRLAYLCIVIGIGGTSF